MPVTDAVRFEKNGEAMETPIVALDTNEIPRRCRIELMCEAEHALRRCMHIVEEMGADPHLTDAVCSIGEAMRSVADFVDKMPHRHEGIPALEIHFGRIPSSLILEFMSYVVGVMYTGGPATTERTILADHIREAIRADQS